MNSALKMILCLSLVSVAAIAAPKRKVAQEKMKCVPLGREISYQDFGDNESSKEMKMLRNSIYAQIGFKFKSESITAEMKQRGCAKDMKYDEAKLQKVDKANIRFLKSFEKELRETEVAMNFDGEWSKSAKSSSKRMKLLADKYCYLSDSKTAEFMGYIYFSNSLVSGEHLLTGMMSKTPTWAAGMVSNDDHNVGDDGTDFANISYDEIDSTSAAALDFATKGSWSVGSSKNALEITIRAKDKNFKDTPIQVSGSEFNKKGMLYCSF